MASKAAADGQTEVSVLIPTRSYRRSWASVLHGKNADRLVRVLGHVPHVNATLVPFNVADLAESQRALASELFLPTADWQVSPAKRRRCERFAPVPGRHPHRRSRLPPGGQGGGAGPVGPHPAVVGRPEPRVHSDRRQRRRSYWWSSWADGRCPGSAPATANGR